MLSQPTHIQPRKSRKRVRERVNSKDLFGKVAKAIAYIFINTHYEVECEGELIYGGRSIVEPTCLANQ